ncbi:arylmalonate decarboxylase [Streptomyces sp. NRRL F-6491]|nr:arylmalonate decarboxylase [Streptomyces sp. NRRL F-6491]KOX52301.1 arylmalonate decarboxylase [Streptomyces sp. NRRL F-6492]
MDLLATPRLGVVVPPENPTAEPEFNRLVGERMNVYSSRFPVTPGKGLLEMLEAWNEALPDTLAGFGAMGLDAAVVACSASHYLLAPEGDRAFCEELSDRAGYPVRSSTQAILTACAWLGVERLTLVSPYEPWLTETSAGFWRAAGLTVDEALLVPAREGHFDPYEVTTAAILERVRGARLAEGTALLFTGTGMGTLAALEELGRDDGDRVLLTSNLASAWWALRTAGAGGDPAGGHPLLARLERRAAAVAVRSGAAV